MALTGALGIAIIAGQDECSLPPVQQRGDCAANVIASPWSEEVGLSHQVPSPE
jgi:hypothetical protein